MTNQDFRKTPPPVADMTPITLPPMTTTILPSGLTIHTYRRDDLPLLYMTAVVDGGNAEAGSPALPTIQTVVAREGTESFSAAQIASTLELAGATLKFGAMSHHRSFGMFALEKSLPEVVPVFADIVCRPVFPERETQVRCETFASRFEVAFENVGFLANSESERQIMGADHPLAKIDTPADIRAITPERLRQFTETFASPERVSLYLCGNLSDETLRLIVDAFESRLITRSTAPLIRRPFSPAPAGDRRKITKPEASQSAIYLTMPVEIDRNHPDYMPLHLSVYALGGYFGSRLMRNIREERGLTYGIHAGLHGLPEGTYLCISAEAANRYADMVVSESLEELRRLAADPCRGEELMRIRQSALSTHSAVLDSPVTITDSHIESLTVGLPEGYFNSKQRDIQSLTPEVIATMAARYLDPARARITIAGA